jgi:hypothetical protein
VKKLLLRLFIGLLPFGLNANEMKVPSDVEIDFSKKGTVYETDFQAPWNIWGSLVSFNLIVYYFNERGNTHTELTEEENQIADSIMYGKRNDIPIPKEENQYFKLKVTLTPLGWASNDIAITTIDYSKEGWNKDESKFGWIIHGKDTWQKKEYKDDEKIEFIISIPLYGGSINFYLKLIMIADLQRLRNYHIRVESLEDVELPKDIKTKFDINRESTKH